MSQPAVGTNVVYCASDDEQYPGTVVGYDGTNCLVQYTKANGDADTVSVPYADDAQTDPVYPYWDDA